MKTLNLLLITLGLFCTVTNGEQSGYPVAKIEITESTVSDGSARFAGVVKFSGLEDLKLDTQIEYTKFFTNRADFEFSNLKWGGHTIQGFTGKIEFNEKHKIDPEQDQFVVFLITLKTKDTEPETIRLWATQQIKWKSQPEAGLYGENAGR